MTDSILDDIWSRVKAVRIDHDLSDQRLLHLGRLHLSLHELNAYIRRDDAAGKRSAILHRIEQLFDECVSRCRGCDDSGRLGRFVPLLYRLARPSLVPIKDEQLCSCDTVAEQLVDPWVKQESFSWEEDHGAMRAVIELTCMLDKPERECDPAFRKYRNVLSLWNTTLSGIHAWDNTSDTEALGRLVIMSLNSGMLLDETFDDSLSQSYLYYKRKLGNEKIPLLALPYLLELELENKITNGQGTDMHMIGVIRKTALESMKDCTPERDDDYWLLLSVLTECICTEQLDACCNSICM